MSNILIGPTGTGALPLATSIDAVNDLIPIFQNSTTSTLALNRNTFLGISSQPVGISDTQTLTHKTLTSPTITGGTLSSSTLTTPVLGVATATSINKVALTAPVTGSTLTIADGKTLTVSNSLTLAGTDSTTMTFPTSSDTVVGRASTDTLTNKTISTVTNTISGLTNTNLSGSAGITYANLLSTIFSGRIASIANSGNGGGTLYYINLGGIKILFGNSASNTSSAGGNSYNVNLPSGFFTTITLPPVISCFNMQATASQYASINAYSTADFTYTTTSPPATGATNVAFWMVGT